MEKTNIYNSELVVNINKLHKNIQTILQSLPHDVMLIPVLKDNAYGLGLAHIGQEVAKVDAIKVIAVSNVSESLKLRECGVEKEILVIGGIPSFVAKAAVESGVTIAVGRLGLIPLLKDIAIKLGVKAKVEIKLETGLNRIGLMPGEELEHLINEIDAAKEQIEVRGVFSHFADAQDDVRSKNQCDMFEQGIAQLKEAGICAKRYHIAGSAAIELGKECYYDAVRIGRRLYMDHPTKPFGDIEEVATWRSWVTNIRTLQPTQRLGYGEGIAMDKTTTVATVGIGYGDGLPQALAECKAPVLVAGKNANILGTCMDQCFIDVTNIECSIDDEVVFFGYSEGGKFLSSQKVSLLIGGNEGCGLTSALASRVKRTYV